MQDIEFINDKEFISSGDVVFRESAEYSIMVWDYETNAVVSNQIFHVNTHLTINFHSNYKKFFNFSGEIYLYVFEKTSKLELILCSNTW